MKIDVKFSEDTTRINAKFGEIHETSGGDLHPDALVVTLNEDRTQASHTAAEIGKHVRDGGVVYLKLDANNEIALSSVWFQEDFPEDASVYFNYTSDDGFIYTLEIYGSGEFEEYEHSTHGYATSLIVTLSKDKTTASHTPKEIYEHIQSGGVVYLDIDGQYYGLTSVSYQGENNASADFAYPSGEEAYNSCWQICFDGSVQYFENWFAGSNVYEEIGNLKDEVKSLKPIRLIWDRQTRPIIEQRYDDLTTAARNGRNIYLDTGGSDNAYLIGCNGNCMMFTHIDIDTMRQYYYKITKIPISASNPYGYCQGEVSYIDLELPSWK